MVKRTPILLTSLLLCGLILAGNILASAAEAVPPYKNTALSAEKRAEDLLGRMTLEEKIQYVSGVRSQFIREIPRLGLPAIDMEDGPLGVHNGGTAFPPALTLAASYDPALAQAWGEALGRDCRAIGVNVTLGPGMNIARSPLLGRSCEYFGEDPYLAAHMVPSVIKGVQSQGVMACAKHYVGNEMELVRTYSDSLIDERTLREIYLPPFEASVKEGNVASIMGAYNTVNGQHACVNQHTLKDILRDDFGFDGIILSDWGAGSGPAEVWANGPLDLAMPEGPMGDPKVVLPLIQEKKIDPAVYDTKVRHILRKCIEFGFFDRPQKNPELKPNDDAARAVALQVSREGMVLLKNRRHLLPLDRSAIKSIAVIGPHADKATDGTPYATGISGSSWQDVANPVTVLQGVRALAGDGVKVVTAPDPIRSLYATTQYEHIGADGKPAPGMKASYYKNKDLSGKPALERVDADLNFGSNWRNKGWLTELRPFDNLSVRWEGQIKPAQDGQYQFVKECNPGMRIWLDGELLVDDFADFQRTRIMHQSVGVVKELKGGKTYSLKIDYINDPELLAHMWGVRFGWGPVGESEAIKAARECDVAVVCVGFDYTTEGEGIERTFELPYGQAELIRDVTKANPKTVVVLTSGGACDTKEWIAKVPAMIQAWYFAAEGGKAVAEILFGDVNPSGKLPVTFDRNLADNPSTPYFTADWSKKPGLLPVYYTEGVFVGYRGYDKSGKKPLFPFGHGLSYTKFKYGNLQITPNKAEAGAPVTVTCTLKNTGKVSGAEVVQLYVGDKHAPVERPVRELKGFKRVELKPGESRTVSFTLDNRAFAYYDVNAKAWSVAPGKFQISLGSSSRDLRLKGSCNLSAAK